MRQAPQASEQGPRPLAGVALRNWLLPLILALAFGATRSPVRAQNPQGNDENFDTTVEGDVIVRRAILNDQRADQFIFGQVESVEEARSRMDQALRRQVRQLNRRYHLTAAQQEKLLLAGRGDIKRALDRVAELKRKFQLAKFERLSLMNWVEEARRLQRALQAVTTNADSLFSKTVAATITDEQVALADKALHESHAAAFEAALADAAARLFRVLDLTEPEHSRLVTVMRSEIHQPRRFGNSGYAYVMHELSKVPENKIRPTMREPKWKLLHQLLSSWHDARKFLENDGFVFDSADSKRDRTTIR
jgi:hypothetical protein